MLLNVNCYILLQLCAVVVQFSFCSECCLWSLLFVRPTSYVQKHNVFSCPSICLYTHPKISWKLYYRLPLNLHQQCIMGHRRMRHILGYIGHRSRSWNKVCWKQHFNDLLLWKVLDLQCESKKSPPPGSVAIFPKQFEIFWPNFTCLLCLPIYATMLDEVNIKCNHPACVSVHSGHFEHVMVVAWHNFVKVAGNWIKICSPV